MPNEERKLLVVTLGRLGYAEALELQRAVARARIAGEVAEDVLLLLEHPPVVTLGRTAKERHLVASAALLAARGVEVFEVERGGDVTFHGPGQLVGYPIVDLRRHRQDLHWYLRQVEEALIRALGAFGIAAGRDARYTGVWVGADDAAADASKRYTLRSGDGAPTASSGDRDLGGGPPREGRPPDEARRTVAPRKIAPRKIASIGVHARDWVTWHGFALNVTTELSYFDLIIPCGIPDVVMTSVARELGCDVAMRGVEDAVASAFGEAFALDPVRLEPDELRSTVAR